MAAGIRCPECDRVYTGSDTCPYCEKGTTSLYDAEVTTLGAGAVVIACGVIFVAVVFGFLWAVTHGIW